MYDILKKLLKCEKIWFSIILILFCIDDEYKYDINYDS